MNSFLYFDNQFLLQQQLLLQQLIQYNSMIAIRNACNISTQSTPQVKPKSPQESNMNYQQTLKNDETNDDQSSLELPKTLKIQKNIKKNKDIKNNIPVSDQNNSKKKIFLSMKDIQDVQYKKYKIISETQVQQEESNNSEKK